MNAFDTNITNSIGESLLGPELVDIFIKYYTYPLGTVGFLSNMSVMVSSAVIMKSTDQHRATYIILVNLSLCQAVLSLVVLATMLYLGQRNHFPCSILFGLIHLLVTESSLNVMLNSVERYIYICHGLYYRRWMSNKTTVYFLVGSWILSLVSGYLPKVIFYQPNNGYCLYFSSTPMVLTIYMTVVAAVSFLLTVFIYKSISNEAKQFRKRNRSRYKTSSDRRRKTKGVESDSISCISIKNVDGESSAPGVETITESGKCNDAVENNYNDRLLHKQKSTRKSVTYMMVFTMIFSFCWGPSTLSSVLYVIYCNLNQFSRACVNYEYISVFFIFNFALLGLLLTPIAFWWWHIKFRKTVLLVCFKHSNREKRRREIVFALKK